MGQQFYVIRRNPAPGARPGAPKRCAAQGRARPGADGDAGPPTTARRDRHAARRQQAQRRAATRPSARATARRRSRSADALDQRPRPGSSRRARDEVTRPRASRPTSGPADELRDRRRPRTRRRAVRPGQQRPERRRRDVEPEPTAPARRPRRLPPATTPDAPRAGGRDRGRLPRGAARHRRPRRRHRHGRRGRPRRGLGRRRRPRRTWSAATAWCSRRCRSSPGSRCTRETGERSRLMLDIGGLPRRPRGRAHRARHARPPSEVKAHRRAGARWSR